MFPIVEAVFAGLVGLAFGSFLNVCLTRWPEGESVVGPGSHCRNCGQPLPWWQNVPVLSWLALRGRCRQCRVWIGWRYPIVELAVGITWAAIVVPFPWQDASHEVLVSYSPRGLTEHLGFILAKLLLSWLLVGLAALDAEHLWLPDSVTLPGIGAGVAVTLLMQQPLVRIGRVDPSVLSQILHLALAILIAGGSILLIHWIYWLLRRREGIGLGDAKLMAMLAAWLGLPGTLLAFVIGVLIGAAVGIVVLVSARSRKSIEHPALLKLPLGTFLCIGGLVSTIWGTQLISLYSVWAGL